METSGKRVETSRNVWTHPIRVLVLTVLKKLINIKIKSYYEAEKVKTFLKIAREYFTKAKLEKTISECLHCAALYF